MDEDDFFSSRPQDPLTLLMKQDLGPLSIDELKERIELLKAEIERVEHAGRHRLVHDQNVHILTQRGVLRDGHTHAEGFVVGVGGDEQGGRGHAACFSLM